MAGDIAFLRRLERCVVVDKPSGLLSVPGKGEANQDCVISRVREAIPDASGPMCVHRLDMDTSGLMVVALDAEAHRELSRQFEKRTVGKRYEALVDGRVDGQSGEIRLWQRVDIENRPHQILDDIHGKEAVTRWQTLGVEVYGGLVVTRVEFSPVTGRSHQLRVASATGRDEGGLGCPIVGDDLYGDGKASAERLMLHARWLAFDEPAGGGRVEVEAEVPF
ncbi:MAG: RluA family pseudouridine synthase [Planctomycetota bacterium]|jgi:tRNA pseudouridine32 synthase/23S rRNA pseudouridine746 synthase